METPSPGGRLNEISRCTGPDGDVHLDLCAFGGSVDALARPCWCGDVGAAQNVRGFVVLAEHADEYELHDEKALMEMLARQARRGRGPGGG